MKEVTITGTVYDDDGHKLAWNDSVNDIRKYADPYIYSSLLSYASGGLQYQYYDELYTPGKKKYEVENKIVYKGADIHTTLDQTFQKFAYNAIRDYEDASVVILDREGAVKAMVSSGSFDINAVNTEYTQLASEEGGLLNPAVDFTQPCGSVLKPVIAQALSDYGYAETFTVNDQGKVEVDGATISNAGSASYGQIGMQKALVHSSNVYFIEASHYLGEDIVSERYKELFIGENISTDFGKIKSVKTDIVSDYDLAMAAIGQNLSLSTTHLAMIMQAVTTGEMMKPYMIRYIEKDGKAGDKTKKEVLSSTGSTDQSISRVNEMLTASARSYGITEEKTGTGVMAKTGTAEDDAGQQIATIIAAWPADDPEYFMAIQSRHTYEYGSSLAEATSEIINLINR